MFEKIRGSLLGVLIGDCYGLPFEQDVILDSGVRLVLRQYFDKLEGPLFKAPRKSYSDDTAQTFCVAQTLIDKGEIDQKDLAVNFVKEYYKNPRRGYSNATGDLFSKLRKTGVDDPLIAAKQQFNGTGSYGNGAAMRIAPIALFCHNKDYKKVIEMSTQSAHITHSHKLGVNGAILQALAIHQLLPQLANTEVNSDFDAENYIKELETKMATVETDKDDFGFEIERPYQKQLKQVLRLLKADEPTDQEIVHVLGHKATALHSVPTAIYCFLKGQNEIKGIETKNPFRRSLEYAIGLGGDTDTIASMTGALSGAFYGDKVIAENLIKHCEDYEVMEDVAQKLFEASKKV